MPKTSVYTVKSGDSLDKIARQFGFSNWKKLYDSGLNAKLRKLRPDPNKVKPGDTVIVPGSGLTVEGQKSLDAAIKAIMKRIEAQDALIKLIDKTTDDMAAEILSAAKKIDKNAQAIDVATFLVNVSGNVAKIAVKSQKMASATPALVKKLSDESAKEAVKMAVSPAKIARDGLARRHRNASNDVVRFVSQVVDAWAWGTSPSTAYLVGINLADGAFIRQAKQGQLKDAAITFAQCFGKDPADEMRRRVTEMRKVDAQRKMKIIKTLSEDQSLIQELLALKK